MARGRRTSRPDFSWANFGDIEAAVDLSVATAQMGTTALEAVVPQTLTRIRGKVALTLNAAGVGESVLMVCGLLIMNKDAFAVGNTAAPELVLNGIDEASWIWQGTLYVDSGDEAAVNTNFLTDSIEVDSKAMRKQKPGQTLVFIWQANGQLVQDMGGVYDLTYFFHCLAQS